MYSFILPVSNSVVIVNGMFKPGCSVCYDEWGFFVGMDDGYYQGVAIYLLCHSLQPLRISVQVSLGALSRIPHFLPTSLIRMRVVSLSA
jgi:hypothetical protein